MVVVREDGPLLEFPAEVATEAEEAVFEEGQLFGGVEKWVMMVGRGGDDVGSGVVDLMRRGVGPARHGGILAKIARASSTC